MLPVLVLAAMLLPAGAALAQPRPFTCIGAEQLEEDVFAIPFAKGKAAPGEAARTNLAAAAERAKREPGRNLCVLGHVGPQEGGAQSGIQLAARRAGEVATALAKLGIERDRMRAEARRAAFAKGAVPEERSVTVVLLPAGAGEAAEKPAASPATRAPERPAAAPATRLPAPPATAPAPRAPEQPAANPAPRAPQPSDTGPASRAPESPAAAPAIRPPEPQATGPATRASEPPANTPAARAPERPAAAPAGAPDPSAAPAPEPAKP